MLKSLWDKGLVYRGVKCVPYSWAINTPLSNFEANLNYKVVQDPAVTVRAKILGEVAAKLGFAELSDHQFFAYSWTTTPWTLPSNMALAVGADVQYSLVVLADRKEVAIVCYRAIG